MSKVGEQIRGRLQRLAKKVEVPEWGEEGKPLELYFFPLTVNDAKKLNTYVRGKGEQTREDEYVYFVIFNARDEHGDLVFDLADAEWLSNQPLTLIMDIWLACNVREGFSENVKK